MKTLRTYPLRVTELQYIELPRGAEGLSLQFQGKQLVLWALVNPDLPDDTTMQVWLCGVGCRLPDTPGQYLGLVSCDAKITLCGFLKLYVGSNIK